MNSFFPTSASAAASVPLLASVSMCVSGLEFYMPDTPPKQDTSPPPSPPTPPTSPPIIHDYFEIRGHRRFINRATNLPGLFAPLFFLSRALVRR